jgi:hypothetical protein
VPVWYISGQANEKLRQEGVYPQDARTTFLKKLIQNLL